MLKKDLAQEIVKVVRDFVGQQVGAVSKAIDLINKRLDDLPKAKDGAPGADGAAGKDGAPGERGADGEKGEKGDRGDQGEKGDAGERGEQGPAGERGEKGEAGDAGPPGDPGAAGDQGPAGEKGEPGAAGEKGAPGADGLKGDPGERGEKGEPGAQGDAGRDGAPGADGQKGADGLPGERGEKGEPGEKGADGEHGRDALDIDILPAINETRRYARGTFASHRGGLWIARRSTDGMDGWECIVDGIAAVEAVQDPDDPRGIALGIKTSSGAIVEKMFRVPFVVDRGVFKEGTQYAEGDGVSWGGSFWIARQETKAKPDAEASGWRVAVRRGRDGKDGRDGIDKTLPVKLEKTA